MPLDMQPSFTGGEITPSLHSRADLERYATSVALLQNWVVQKHGGIKTRAGFEFIYELLDPTKLVRLIEFEFNVEQTYILMLTDAEMRVIKQDGVVLNSNFNISSISLGSTTTVTTSSAHGFTTGQQVFITGIDSTVELNNRFYEINVTSTTEFRLNGVDSSGYTAWGSASGTVATVYVQTTPWAEADLARLKYTQSADVMTVCHPSYPPQTISRTAHNNWAVSAISFATALAAPVIQDLTFFGVASSSDDRTYRYQVTAVDANGQESQPSTIVESESNDALSSTWGIGLVWDEVSGAEYYRVYKELARNSDILGYIGESEPKDESPMTITNITSGPNPTITFASPHGMETAGEWITFSGTGTSLDGKYRLVSDINTTNSITIESGLSSGTSTTGTAQIKQSFGDFNLGPDLSETPPIQNNPFDSADNYPSCVTFHQQRKTFGASNNNLQRIWLTRTGNYDNMDYSRPLKADDSIQFDIAAAQVNAIRHILSLDELLIFTSGAEWVVKGDENGVLTPDFQLPKKQSKRGCSHLRPLVVGDTAVFLQDKGSRVRDLGYRFESDKFVSDDLSLLAEHLFEDNTIVDWCYSQEPHSIIWAVRDDGILLSLCYIKEQKVWGWSRHNTDGTFENVACISEGKEDAVYATVKRTINGNEVRYIERLHTRSFDDIEDAFCVDSGLTFTGDVKTVDAVSVGTATVITSTTHGLSNGDVIWLKDVGGFSSLEGVRYVVANATASNFTLHDFDGRNIDSSTLTYTSGGEIRVCQQVINNLDHLEGETVVALADGNVDSGLTVSGGQVTLSEAAHIAHIGIPYCCDMQSLDVDISSRNETRSRKRVIPRVALEVLEARGLKVGGSFDKLREIKEREVSDGYDNLPTVTGTQYININATWSERGRVCVRQDYPLPASITALIPEVVTVERA